MKKITARTSDAIVERERDALWMIIACLIDWLIRQLSEKKVANNDNNDNNEGYTSLLKKIKM